MPLKNYQSLCAENASQIVSRDKGKPQYHKAINRDKNYVTQYQIDGIVIRDGVRCDFLLINEDKKNAYLIELKGSDLIKAAEQLDRTESVLHNELTVYNIYYRIVANKCVTHDIKSSAYRKYQVRWNRRLVQKTGYIEEQI